MPPENEEKTTVEGQETETKTTEVDYKAKAEAAEARAAAVEAEKQALAAKNQEILGKLATSKEKLEEINRLKAEAEKADLDSKGQHKELADILQRERDELTQKVGLLEGTIQERENTLVQDEAEALFIKEMGNPEFHDRKEALAQVDWKKFVKDPQTKEFVKSGVEQALKDFREKKGHHVVPTAASAKQDAAGGSTAGQAEDIDTYYTRLMNKNK